MQHIGTLLPTITKIVNLSMATGTFPFQFKKALVTHLLKKPSLDVNVLKNYRPVSNLPYISKVTEKVVAARLPQHVQENGMQERMQSAYHAHHGTETAPRCELRIGRVSESNRCYTVHEGLWERTTLGRRYFFPPTL